VRDSLPEVLVPELPVSPLLYPSTLARMDCFDVVTVTAEDRARHASYQAGRARMTERERAGSVDEWLQNLDVKVRVGTLNASNLPRVAQLLNKTNQMNLSTRRLTAPELLQWAGQPGHHLWAFRVADRFEDAGLTGIISIAVDRHEAHVVDFVLSCRVMGRQIEEAMLHHAVQHARELGLETLSAEYLPTAKNAPTLRFLERSGLENGDGHRFRWELQRHYARPQHLTVEMEAGE
jgi:FkbH-like protein